jgi:hypothetical protein
MSMYVAVKAPTYNLSRRTADMKESPQISFQGVHLASIAVPGMALGWSRFRSQPVAVLSQLKLQ